MFAAFLLSQTATTMVFGKLADMFGRKPVLLAGIAIFLVGSALCGFASSMPMLIGFRLLQGLGAGAIQPIALTVVGDLYPGQERGRVQGYLSSVWGISSMLGPLAGGLITQHLSWAWVFWINLPVGAVCAALFALFLHEELAHAERRVDVAGAVLFSVSVAALMTALTELGASGRNALARRRGVRDQHDAVRAPGAAGSRPDGGVRAVGAPPDRVGQRGDHAGRHGPDRAHRLPADVCAGRARTARRWWPGSR